MRSDIKLFCVVDIHFKIHYLRDQRDSKIDGGYRDILVETYNFIKCKIDESDMDYCNPYGNDICKAVLRDILQLKEGELLTYEKLSDLGIDSIVITKISDKKYKIDFTVVLNNL